MSDKILYTDDLGRNWVTPRDRDLANAIINRNGPEYYAAPHLPSDLSTAPGSCNANFGQRLPTDAAARKAVPLATGCLDYFPDALAAVAELSRIGNEQHNPGKPLHWDRAKSTDEADCLIRHFIDRGTIDTDGVRHSAKVAWRALALLQKEIEAARNAT